MLILFQNSRNIKGKKDTKNVPLPVEAAEAEQVLPCFPGEEL